MRRTWGWASIMVILAMAASVPLSATANEAEGLVEQWLTASFPDPHGRWEAWILNASPALIPGEAYTVSGVTGVGKPKKIMTFILHRQGEPAGRVQVQARVARFIQVAVTRRILRRGEALRPEDWEWKETNAEGLAADAVQTPEDLDGRRCKKALARGEALTRHALEPLPDVASGAALTVRVMGEGVVIDAEALSLEEGRIGDWVKLRLLKTGAGVEARLETPTLAKIILPSR